MHMKNLFRTFKKSIYNPSFYQDVGNVSYRDSFRYYSKCILLLSVVMTIALGILFIPAGVQFIKNRAPGLVNSYYPAGLVVNIGKGEASANVAMPYFVPVPGAASTTSSVQNFLVIDTAHEFDKKTFDGYKTFALLTKTDLVTSNDNGQITIETLRGAPALTVSKDVLLSWIEKINQLLVPLSITGVVIMFIIIIAGYFLYLLPLLLFALVPLLVGWVRKTPLSYSGAYKMSLHAIVPALVIKTALNLMGLFFLPEYLTFLIFMLIIAINMRDSEQPKLLEI